MLRKAKYYWRMLAGTHRLLRTPPHADPQAVIGEQMAHREERFLETVRRVVFGAPANPYHRMFRLAGCGFEDLAESVRRDGLEDALASLARQGVYLTHDEFKGRQPLVRSGEHIPATIDSFLNPLAAGMLASASSGSSGPRVHTSSSTENRLHREAYFQLVRQELGLAGRAYVQALAILPSGTGLFAGLQEARRGGKVDRWFAVGGNAIGSGHYRAGTSLLVLFARLLGAGVAFPTYLPRNDYSPAARWIAQRRGQGIACVVASPVSPAVRIVAAALEHGLDIRGTLFIAGGEALTEAKRAVFESARVDVYTGYWIHEIGPIGFACREMRSANCVHLYRDSVAVISRRRRAPLSEVEVDSLMFTTLLPSAARVLINAEMDDTGVIEPARCRCTFSELGFDRQIRDIFSFGKLTGQGITLLGSDVVRALEVALPARFGGAPGDFQLVEYEGPRQTQLRLRVNPRLGRLPADKVRECFLEAIRPCAGGVGAARLFRHTGAIEVVLDEPYATATGKIHPLHLLGARQNRDAA